MFERRLKIFLGVLLLVTVTLVLRAAQVQVLNHKHWEVEAANMRKRSEHIATRRGVIRDFKGVSIAVDEPCVDACVDFRALAPNPDKAWVEELAKARLRERMGADAYLGTPLAQRKVMVAEESEKVRDDIRQLVPRLARISGRKETDLEDARIAIVEKVKMRRRFVWYYTYKSALDKHRDGVEEAQTRPTSLWQKWLLDDGEDAPEPDSFELRVLEETAKHVVVRDVELDVQTELAKHSDRFPGLELRPGTRRVYPLGGAGAHVIGRMSKVTKADIKRDPLFADELRQYQQTDLKGRGGLEELWEPVLRGVRGKTDHVDGREVAVRKPQPGRDVFASIDVELQHEVEQLFEHVTIKTRIPGQAEPLRETVRMHGAAVVIDVPTGEVRVLASAPGFDPNLYEQKYAEYSDPDNLDIPLLNRATQALREPGSTVKPIVGLAGVAAGVRRADEGYTCTGYMSLNGKPYRWGGRCWVNSMFHKDLCGPNCREFPCPRVAHHPVPSNSPLMRPLTLSDALERSCNPYFESIADALGPTRLSDWYRKFGLGVRTEIGIAESRGRVPEMDPNKPLPKTIGTIFKTWTAGIGQGFVHATPLQMANVSATIARGGIWARPTLLRKEQHPGVTVSPTTKAADRVDLGLPPEAIRAVREGMFKVVHTVAGSGEAARRPDVGVAGKTGTAEAVVVSVPVLNPRTGQPLTGADGKVVNLPLPLSTHDAPNPKAPWHRGTGREGGKPHHSWFIGYAPADKPQIAFAVLVEYGGSGGGAAGSVANQLIQLCINHGHLKPPVATTNPADAVVPVAAAADEDVPTGADAGAVEAGANVPMSVPAVAAPLAPPQGVELLRDVPVTTRAGVNAE